MYICISCYDFVSIILNIIRGVMVSVLASSVVDCGFESYRVKPKTIILVFAASALGTQL
jgi:hypothetical protein